MAARAITSEEQQTVDTMIGRARTAMSNLGWTVISDVAPKQVIGLTGGIFNFSTNLAGIVTPIVIGVAFGMTGSFVGPLVYIGVVALIGAFSYTVILGDIHRLDIGEPPAAPVTVTPEPGRRSVRA